MTAVEVSPEVADALAGGRGVVALESTIISHGMPYPDNLATARGVEQVVRDHGAVPATIALVDGRVRVGLDDAALERLAAGGDEAGAGIEKASRRDLPVLVARKATAGTTVAATMFLAHRAGVAVFATGGIGGVHRGVERTLDVSADLVELGATPVTVVCAGAKSILDLPRTLEVLETQGVPVIGVGTDEFPAFFSRESGLAVPHRVESAAELAAVVTAHRDLGLPGGILVANPIPEADAVPAAEIGARIEEALADGRSLVANVALVRNNAALAADLSVQLTR
jgi:pseudouridine-5'-phosphate glycosidase